jgi:hypothetical protein
MWARDAGQLSVRLSFARNYSTSIPASFGLEPSKTAPELLQSVPIPLNFGLADSRSQLFISDRRKQAVLRNDSQEAFSRP